MLRTCWKSGSPEKIVAGVALLRIFVQHFTGTKGNHAAHDFDFTLAIAFFKFSIPVAGIQNGNPSIGLFIDRDSSLQRNCRSFYKALQSFISVKNGFSVYDTGKLIFDHSGLQASL